MKKQSLNNIILRLRICIILLITVIMCAFLFSFTVNKINEGFLTQLGISKTNADSKITKSMLGGYLDAYGLSNAKNIAVGNRAAVAIDLLTYSKQQVNSPAFRKEYDALRESYKPKPLVIQTPEEMRKSLIDQYKKAVQETEVNIKKADASIKSIFEESLVSLKEALKKAADPDNEMIKSYSEGYPALAKQTEENNERQLKEWEEKYPESPMPFVKQRLQQFLDETSDINFDAELVTKYNHKVFVNPVYERKGNRWKMAYRAGKEVILPVRKFVQDWLAEIK